MKRTGWKQLCAAMLTLAMVLTVAPGAAFAVDATGVDTEAAWTSSDVETKRVNETSSALRGAEEETALPPAHPMETEKGTDAACMENDCQATTQENANLEQGEIAAHIFGEWQESKPATETETGLRVRKCVVCGAVEEEVLPLKPPTGWQRNIFGWWYNDENGNYVTGWQQVDGSWYYFASNGYMQTGWQQINGYWYYFAPGGDMQTGWQLLNGSWYYFAPGGDMLTGWQKVNGSWYYLSYSGDMRTGWENIHGYWYYFSPSGDMQTGWQMINGYWYYFAPGGDMQTDWQKVNGSWYYFSRSGSMQTGWQKIRGYWYYFTPSGDMQTGWQLLNGSWYYLASGGDMQTGWLQLNGYWYYLSGSGVMQTGWQWINGACYYFESSGCMGKNPVVWPCDSHYISSPFGPRPRPMAGASSFHNGLDIADFSGAAIYAAASGTVLCAGYNGYRGYYIEISHGNGMKTVYMHCKQLYVKAGDTVSAGQHIAAMGSTGVATGAHLHFGVMVNGCYQDPKLMWAN